MSDLKPVILCLDVGTKRIGIAKSDALGIAAHALPMIERKSDEQAVSEIAALIEREKVEKLVIGLPVRMNDSEGPAVTMVREFAGALKKKIRVPVDFWDERLSTAEAERFLIDEADMSRKKRKTKIDSLAAQIILQSYMRNKGSDPF